MRNDPGSNFTITGDDVSATDTTAGSTKVDHASGPSASFFIICKSVATSLDAKAQYSDNGTDWTDYTATNGNDAGITQLTAAGTGQLNVANPLGRYSRVLCTAVGAVVATCTSILGPLRHVAPS